MTDRRHYVTVLLRLAVPCARQIDMNRGSFSKRAPDVEPAAVAQHDMLDDGEAEPGAADRAAAPGIDPVEALGEPRDMLGRDALALVDDAAA